MKKNKKTHQFLHGLNPVRMSLHHGLEMKHRKILQAFKFHSLFICLLLLSQQLQRLVLFSSTRIRNLCLEFWVQIVFFMLHCLGSLCSLAFPLLHSFGSNQYKLLTRRQRNKTARMDICNI